MNAIRRSSTQCTGSTQKRTAKARSSSIVCASTSTTCCGGSGFRVMRLCSSFLRRRNGPLFEFSLCSSRVCLGNMIVLIYKWRKKTVFSPRVRDHVHHLFECERHTHKNAAAPCLHLVSEIVPSLSWRTTTVLHQQSTCGKGRRANGAGGRFNFCSRPRTAAWRPPSRTPALPNEPPAARRRARDPAKFQTQNDHTRAYISRKSLTKQSHKPASQPVSQLRSCWF
eukprot:COSAG06_NODE_541_length_14471_cov_35.139229_13_plen_225_part_00